MFEGFYQKYETQEQEVIALIRKCIGAGHHKGDNGDFWDMTAITLGMVFCNTGKVSIKEGRLEWPVTEEERNSEKGWGRLQQGQICRLRYADWWMNWCLNIPLQSSSTAGLL